MNECKSRDTSRPVISHVMSALTMSEPWILVKCGIAFLKIYLKLDMDHVWEDCAQRASERVGYNKSGREGAP